MIRKMYSVQQVAECTTLSETKIYSLLASGKLKGKREPEQGGHNPRWMIREDWLEEYLQPTNQQQQPPRRQSRASAIARW